MQIFTASVVQPETKGRYRQVKPVMDLRQSCPGGGLGGGDLLRTCLRAIKRDVL
jgi:hypothetical protein